MERESSWCVWGENEGVVLTGSTPDMWMRKLYECDACGGSGGRSTHLSAHGSGAYGAMMATRRTSSVWIASQNDMVCSKRVCARVCTCVRFHGADGRVCLQSVDGFVFAERK